MLVGALRSDNPLGGAPLTCDDATEAFFLQGIGEISAAKLLDLENRRQLVWSDLVTREWALETAAIRVRRETAAKAAAAAAAAGAVAATALPPAAARGPAGVPAATTRFATPVDDGRVAGRLVWSEAMTGEGAASDAGAAPNRDAAADKNTTLGRDAAPDEAATLGGALSLAVQADARMASVPAAAWRPPSGPPDRPRQAGEYSQAIVTRRADRRRSLQQARQHRRLSMVSGRAAAVALFAVALVVVVLVAQHGGF